MNKEERLTVAYAIIALSGCTLQKIPAGTKYIAQDSDGEWYAYSYRPASPDSDGVRQTNATAVVRELHKLGYGDKPKDASKAIYKL